MATKLNNLIMPALLVVVLSAAALAQTPLLINYQGRVLDAAGAPVSDGPHNFDFAIYDMSAAGLLLWSEPGIAINTAGGLFTYALSSSVAFPVDLFTGNLELWLEVTVDGQLQSPRTRLISNPYAETAGNLSYFNPITNNIGFNTNPVGNQFITYGADGQEQIRLWGFAYGEIFLYDADPTNDLTAVLTANSSSGGQLILTDNGGFPTIDLHGGQTGNTSVEFPTDAIYDDEILDEPGVANKVRSSTFFILSPGDQKIDSVSITLPSSGYVEVTAGCYFNLWHTLGTETTLFAGVSKTSSLSFTDPGAVVGNVHPSLPSGLHEMPCVATRLYSETAGTKKYYFVVDRFRGTNNNINVAQIYIRAKFFPTAYGSIVLSTSGNDPETPQAIGIPADGTVPYENLSLRVQTLEEINAKLEAERQALRAESERLRLEKEQLRETQQRSSSATPNQNQK